jgi:hypothetical protein
MTQRHFADEIDKSNPDHPTDVTDNPNLSTEHQKEGDARRPSELLDKGQPPSEETIPRKSSLL